MVDQTEFIDHFFRTKDSKFLKCLEPAMSCPEKPIKAHSIQNSRVLDILESNGHVIMLRPKFHPDSFDVQFQKIGRNQASTFTGLCAKHDSAIFHSLDTQLFNPNNPEHLFLLAYRSVTRGLHAACEAALRLQSSYQFRVEKGIAPSDAPSPSGTLATEHLFKSWQTWRYRYMFFDKALVAKKWNAIKHYVIVLNSQPPAVAVSSLFSFAGLEHDNDDVRCILNVMPLSQNMTIVVFSYAKPDARLCRRALRTILKTSGEKQKYEISKLILGNIENFVLSPVHFDTWPPDKIQDVSSAFAETIFDSSAMRNHSGLMLF